MFTIHFGRTVPWRVLPNFCCRPQKSRGSQAFIHLTTWTPWTCHLEPFPVKKHGKMHGIFLMYTKIHVYIYIYIDLRIHSIMNSIYTLDYVYIWSYHTMISNIWYVQTRFWPNLFHQPGFPWNKGISLHQLPFWVRSCDVVWRHHNLTT